MALGTQVEDEQLAAAVLALQHIDDQRTYVDAVAAVDNDVNRRAQGVVDAVVHETNQAAKRDATGGFVKTLCHHLRGVCRFQRVVGHHEGQHHLLGHIHNRAAEVLTMVAAGLHGDLDAARMLDAALP